ncbi:hypothetical protein CL653_03755 [bacterium]|nr:hypothetical protein [bacterium]|tara:strand:+ start:993 stop:1427 length:435 start_codon:yes stop_codon:yes gene_type:complete
MSDDKKVVYKKWSFFQECEYDDDKNLTHHYTGDHHHWFKFNDYGAVTHYKTTLIVPIKDKSTMDVGAYPGKFWEFWKTYDDEGKILNYKDSNGFEHTYEYNSFGDCVERTSNSSGGFEVANIPREMHKSTDGGYTFNPHLTKQS